MNVMSEEEADEKSEPSTEPSRQGCFPISTVIQKLHGGGLIVFSAACVRGGNVKPRPIMGESPSNWSNTEVSRPDA